MVMMVLNCPLNESLDGFIMYTFNLLLVNELQKKHHVHSRCDILYYLQWVLFWYFCCRDGFGVSVWFKDNKTLFELLCYKYVLIVVILARGGGVCLLAGLGNSPVVMASPSVLGVVVIILCVIILYVISARSASVGCSELTSNCPLNL